MSQTVNISSTPLSSMIVWNIKNFGNSKKVNTQIRVGDHTFMLSVVPPTKKTLEVILKLKCNLHCEVTAFIKDKEGRARHLQASSPLDLLSGVWCDIWKLDSELFLKEESEFIVDEVTTFVVIVKDRTRCTVLLSDFWYDRSTQTSRKEDDTTDLDNLSLEFSKLLNSECNSDVILKCDGKVFHAHRLFLASRSKVFASMFQKKLKENEKDLICIKDIDASDLEQFLRYVYSGKLDSLSENSAKRLYGIADKFAVEFLKKKCSLFLEESLTEINALSILAFANAHEDSILIGSVMHFIAQREDIMNSEQWCAFGVEHLKPEIDAYRAFLRIVSDQIQKKKQTSKSYSYTLSDIEVDDSNAKQLE